MHQSEAQLERELVRNLQNLGYKYVKIKDRNDLELNLKTQLEKFNNTTFSELEYKRITNYLNKGDKYDKSINFRDRFPLTRDEDNSYRNKKFYVKFFDSENLSNNIFQVTNQVSQKGSYVERYDVTILINGIPIVQIELKRRGLEMKEAFNQIERYKNNTFTNSLYDFIQIFVISNGVNTKYFANTQKTLAFAQTFYWTDINNKKITRLEDFTNTFLEKNKLAEYVSDFIVLNQGGRIPMVMRPYQYYASKEIEKCVKNNNGNGYIWHTTGSGKTLTSFKTSQLLSRMPDVKKVLFVVDRKDLDNQTTEEYNNFSKGSVDGSTSTRLLVEQLKDVNRKLIVTTIQKLQNAVKSKFHSSSFEYLKNEKVIIIFDECHRSQFGETHANIKNFFKNSQLFGFTGTPILEENNVGGVTTTDVFEKRLHQYIITDAISDQNVLGFSVEYVGRYKKKMRDSVSLDSESGEDLYGDEFGSNINTKELFEKDERLETISKYLLSDWKKKTKNGKFNAMFAVSSVDLLKKYYVLLNKYKPADFKIATIFTYQANEEVETNSEEENPEKFNNTGSETPEVKYSREFLDNCIKEYNENFNTNFNTESFYKYYKDLQDRIKNKEIDLVLVVNMFLTGFDSKLTNTLYLDKKLQYHGLIQAFSRTNRIVGSEKPHGNIVSFRNLKKFTDQALKLFGDENARDVVFKKHYEEIKSEFNNKVEELKKLVSTPDQVSELKSEELEYQFVKSFRDLLRIKSSLETYSEFKFEDTEIEEQEFYDYQSGYRDIYDKVRKPTTQLVSILEDLDFEIELTRTDNITYDYIILLIAGLQGQNIDEDKIKNVLNVLDKDPNLKSKKELIERFLREQAPSFTEDTNIEKEFREFWDREKRHYFEDFAKNQNIDLEKLLNIISDYIYSGRMPKSEILVEAMNIKPTILERASLVDKIKDGIASILNIFEW